MTGRPTLGVVVMAYGTPGSAADLEAYYTHIRRGRPPTPELLADLRRRYDAIGGTSPLARRTEAQRAGLQGALDRLVPGEAVVVLGQKHAEPFIEDAAADLVARGIRRVVGLVLAPHYSGFSVGEYQRRLREVAEPAGAAVGTIDSWHLEPAYLAFLAGAVAEARAPLPMRHQVLFTAHSLPERVLEGDPYPDQLAATATAVADRLRLSEDAWELGWQSAGATPEPWRGPDVLELIGRLGAARPGGDPVDGICVCAQGFVADHLEVLYDLDIEARAAAADAGLAFARTRSLNDDPAVLRALADRVLAAAPA